MATSEEEPLCNQRGEGALDAHQALQVLLFCPPKSAARVQASAKTGSLARSAGGDALWAAYARRGFGLSTPSACRGPRGEDCGASWARAYALWHGSAADAGLEALTEARVHGPARARWVAVWLRLRQWLSEHAPEIARTLRPAPGLASLRDRAGALADLGSCEWQPAVLGLWCVHDGQDTPMDPGVCSHLGMRGLDGEEEWSRGLLGGYTVYDHEVSTVLLPLRAAVRLTQFFREKVGESPEFASKLVFACSYNLAKLFFVDLKDGSVWVWTGGRSRSMLERAVPSAPSAHSEGVKVRLWGLKARPELNDQVGVLVAFDEAKGRWQVKMEDGSGVHLLKEENLLPEAARREPLAGDGLLRWFEEFAGRLDSGVYRVTPLRPDMMSSSITTRGISLFPVCGPELASCVTRGVEVTASCIYMPEHPQSGWTYSITLRLVGTAAERGYKTCQLHMRHWVIQEEGHEPEHVRGEGVIGFFPVLDDGGWLLNRESDPNQQYQRPDGFVEGAFRYQSCSGRSRSMRGSFGGELTLVPGTIRRPTGPPFQARVETFRLRVPGCIF